MGPVNVIMTTILFVLRQVMPFAIHAVPAYPLSSVDGASTIRCRFRFRFRMYPRRGVNLSGVLSSVKDAWQTREQNYFRSTIFMVFEKSFADTL